MATKNPFLGGRGLQTPELGVVRSNWISLVDEGIENRGLKTPATQSNRGWKLVQAQPINRLQNRKSSVEPEASLDSGERNRPSIGTFILRRAQVEEIRGIVEKFLEGDKLDVGQDGELFLAVLGQKLGAKLNHGQTPSRPVSINSGRAGVIEHDNPGQSTAYLMNSIS